MLELFLNRDVSFENFYYTFDKEKISIFKPALRLIDPIFLQFQKVIIFASA